MWSREGLYVTLLICANVLIASACDYNADSKRAGCSSFDDLQAAGLKPEWEKLAVVGNNNFTSVKANTFANVPNVDDLQIKGLGSTLEAGAFNGLNKIFQLHFDDNKFDVITGEPFSDSPVRWIYIFNCQVREIKRDTFKNLTNLEKIDIQGNHLAVIEEDIFTSLKIKDLILRRNGIKLVKFNAFGDMEKLQWLSLEENELTSFEPQFALGYTPTLRDLFINRNKLVNVTRDMFAVIPNVVNLLLNLNQIKRLGDNVFSDLNEITLLDLSNNHLEEIQPNVFNGNRQNKLQVLFLHNNNLTFLETDVLARLPALKQLAAGGNPWQCPCWHSISEYLKNQKITHICYELYTKGSRPFCVVSDVLQKNCSYDVNSVQDLVKDYYAALSNYPPTPPICNLHGAAQPFLGA